MEVTDGEETKININLIGSPKYRIEVTSSGYKHAESVIDSATKKIISAIRRNKGDAKFFRE